MARRMFDYICAECSAEFEELVDVTSTDPVPCPACGAKETRRCIGATRIDPKLGTDPDFPTAWDKWGRTRRHQTKIVERLKREHGDTR